MSLKMGILGALAGGAQGHVQNLDLEQQRRREELEHLRRMRLQGEQINAQREMAEARMTQQGEQHSEQMAFRQSEAEAMRDYRDRQIGVQEGGLRLRESELERGADPKSPEARLSESRARAAELQVQQAEKALEGGADSDELYQRVFMDNLDRVMKSTDGMDRLTGQEAAREATEMTDAIFSILEQRRSGGAGGTDQLDPSDESTWPTQQHPETGARARYNPNTQQWERI